MSEVGRKISGAAQAVERVFLAATKDLDSGMGAFLSGGNAMTHEPERVKAEAESAREDKYQAPGQEQGQIPQSGTLLNELEEGHEAAR